MKRTLMITVAALSLAAGGALAQSGGGAGGGASGGAGAGGASTPMANPSGPSGGGAAGGGAVERGGAGASGGASVNQDTAPGSAAPNRGAQERGGAERQKSTQQAPSGQPSTRQSADDKAGAPARQSQDGKSGTQNRQQSQDNKSGTGTQQSQGVQDSGAKQGTAAQNGGAMQSKSVSLTTEQKTTIRTTVINTGPRVTNVNFDVKVGVVVPRTVRIAPLPATLVTIEPSWRGYMYFVYNDEIIIVEPRTLRIIEVIVI